MSLNYDISKLDPEFKKTRGVFIQTMTLMTMAVGMGEITSKNWQEFYLRIQLLEDLDGPLFRKTSGEGVAVDPLDIQKLIGMKTNVSNETRTSFINRTMKGRFRSAEYNLRELLEKQKAG